MAIGRRPAGFTSPKRTDATAVPASSPPNNDETMAGTFSVIQPRTKGRPWLRTATVGVPDAATASTSSRWTPGSSQVTLSSPSPTVPKAPMPDWSPTTRITTSAVRASATAAAIPERSSAATGQPAAYTIFESACALDRMPSRNVTTGTESTSRSALSAPIAWADSMRAWGLAACAKRLVMLSRTW